MLMQIYDLIPSDVAYRLSTIPNVLNSYLKQGVFNSLCR